MWTVCITWNGCGGQSGSSVRAAMGVADGVWATACGLGRCARRTGGCGFDGVLLAVQGEYVVHYNGHRPHQGRQQLAQAVYPALPLINDLATVRVRRRTILNGLIGEYSQAA
jgi:hypothetical protein